MKVFFSGIGGSGVSALACYMADLGHAVFGSDRTFDAVLEHPLERFFRLRGISIVPQDGALPDSTFSCAVFSSSIEEDHPEILRAKKTGVPVIRRPDFLGQLALSHTTTAVTGTSGKSTTSGLLAFVLKRLGANPDFIGGGRVKQFASSVNPGNYLCGRSQHLIIEACESDRSIAGYRPEHLMILNLELDHHPVAQTAEWLASLVKNTNGKVILNADDDNLAGMSHSELVTFSVNRASDYRAEDVVLLPFSTEFSVNRKQFTLSLPGRHNVYNAISIIAFLSETGVSLDRVADILPEFKGLERRFDVHLNNNKHLVIDDYAHNPHKIASLMETVQRIRDRVCFIFQPHGFGPTRLMKDAYIRTFVNGLRPADHLVLLPIYYAGGTAARDISSHDLASDIYASGKTVEVIESRSLLIGRTGDFPSYVVFGARDDTLSSLARDIAFALTK